MPPTATSTIRTGTRSTRSSDTTRMASASPSPTGAGVRIGRSPITAAATTVSSAESDIEPGVTSSTSKVTASRAPSWYSAVRM